MKKYNTILISLIILILIRCVDEPEPRAQEYPIFQTSVGEIDDSGVTLTIDVLNRGSGVIKQFGFLLGKEESLDFDTNIDVSFEDELGNTFSTRISSNLSPDVRYVARGYMILDADTVFGNAVDFTSLGSATPSITDFSPTSGIDGDTITLTGTNFSTSLEDVSILFGENSASIVLITIEEIKAIVPQGSISGNTIISLTVFDDNVSIEGFVVSSPTIESISPDAGFDGTEVTLTGNFSKVHAYNKVTFNGINAQIIENSANVLKIISPISSHVGSTNVMINVNDKNSNPVEYYTVGPVIETVSPLEGQHKDVISIEGLEFDNTLLNNVLTIDGTRAKVLSATSTKLEVEVPNITSGTKDIRLQIGNKIADFDQKFNVQSIWGDGQTFPSDGRRSGVSFSINGKGYLGLGTDPLYYTGTTNNGDVFTDLWEFDPSSNSWSQKSDFPGKARYFSSSFVIDGYAYVGIGLEGLTGSSCCDAPYRDFYRFDPSSDTWSKIADFPTTILGNDIGLIGAVSFSVNGKGYVGAGTTSATTGSRKYDFYEYDPEIDQWNKITNPGVLGIYDCGYSYGNKGYAILGTQLWELNPDGYIWTKKADFPGGNRSGAVCFVIGDYAYVGSGSFQKSFFRYDFALDEWTEIESLDVLELYEAFGFSINDMGYVVNGASDNWPYDYPRNMLILSPDN